MDDEELNEQGEPEVERGFLLTAGDIEIFHLIYEHRFLRREQISALSGRPAKRLHRRLLKLAERRYLSTIRLPQQKHIYGIGRAALPVLVEQGIGEPELLNQRLRTHELKELFLKHEMMIVDVHVAMSLASRDGDIRVVDWREGKELYDSVTAVDKMGSNILPVRPDAFFSLEDSKRAEGANQAHFALEADRSTATQQRFQDKIRAYWAYIKEGLHVEKYGIKGMRVLTVTMTDARAKTLCTLAASVVPEPARKYFLFAPIDIFLSEASSALLRSPSAYCARTATSFERHPLVSTPKELQKEVVVV